LRSTLALVHIEHASGLFRSFLAVFIYRDRDAFQGSWQGEQSNFTITSSLTSNSSSRAAIHSRPRTSASRLMQVTSVWANI
jgi:hypothetical protein